MDFIYDRTGHLIAEANHATDTMLREYVWMDDRPVAMVDDTGSSPVVYYIHTDQLGTPQKITDASANIVWDGVFDPFGNATSITGSLAMLLRFPGQYADAETALNQNWFRDYDPTIGRYVESDPVGLKGGINTYAYVRNDPVFHFDTTGLAPNIAPSGLEANEKYQDLSLDICDWWPGACVKQAVICVRAVCAVIDTCGHIRQDTVYHWLPDYPTPKEVNQINPNCTCTTERLNEAP